MVRLFLCLPLALLSLACTPHHNAALPTTIPATAPTGLSAPVANEDVQAIVCPPLGWKADVLKSSERHTHQVWISPSGDTAYGVIQMKLPLPVGPELVL